VPSKSCVTADGLLVKEESYFKASTGWILKYLN